MGLVEDQFGILLRWDKVDKVVYIYSDILGFSPRDKDKLGLSPPPKIAYFLGSCLKIVQNWLDLVGFGLLCEALTVCLSSDKRDKWGQSTKCPPRGDGDKPPQVYKPEVCLLLVCLFVAFLFC